MPFDLFLMSFLAAFLIALGCGILTGIACLASLMNYLLQQQPQPTLAAFFAFDRFPTDEHKCAHNRIDLCLLILR